MQIHALFLILIATTIKGYSSSESSVAFQKILTDGSLVTVTVRSSETNSALPEAKTVPNAVRMQNVRSMITSFSCTLLKNGTNQIVWERAIKSSYLPEFGYSMLPPRVYDVEVRGDCVAVLFSEQQVKLETKAFAEPQNSELFTICDQSSLSFLASAKICWLDGGIYVVGEVKGDGLVPVCFQVNASRVEKIRIEK